MVNTIVFLYKINTVTHGEANVRWQELDRKSLSMWKRKERNRKIRSQRNSDGNIKQQELSMIRIVNSNTSNYDEQPSGGSPSQPLWSPASAAGQPRPPHALQSARVHTTNSDTKHDSSTSISGFDIVCRCFRSPTTLSNLYVFFDNGRGSILTSVLLST